MWVFTETGFVSAVVDWSDPATIVVRARDRVSLHPIASATDAPVEPTPEHDYPFRVRVSRPQFAAWLAESVEAMDYHNFKNRVDETRGERFHDALSRVWGVMFDVQER